MLKALLKPAYKATHNLLYKTIGINPFFRKRYGGNRITKGHISEEHLKDPELDSKLAGDLRHAGIKVDNYHVDIDRYKSFISKAGYNKSYYGGGLDPLDNFTEKTLEHFVSSDLLRLEPGMTFIDIAAATSPYFDLVKKLYGVKNAYRQDLIYTSGIHGHEIGGKAGDLLLEDSSVDAVTLHCSLEHFENNDDIDLFVELERVLKPGGRAIVLPFYLAYEYTIHVDPVFNLLKFHKPQLDNKARLRYCDWYQYFSRHYDVQALQERILNNARSLELKIYKVDNFMEVDKGCYLRFIGEFTKR